MGLPETFYLYRDPGAGWSYTADEEWAERAIDHYDMEVVRLSAEDAEPVELGDRFVPAEGTH